MFTPHVFIDTTGCAFTFLVAKLARCKIVAYVHYPTVSTVSLVCIVVEFISLKIEIFLFRASNLTHCLHNCIGYAKSGVGTKADI